MTRLKMGVVGAVVVGGVVALLVVQRQAQKRLQDEVQVLQLEHQRMESVLADNARLSNLVVQTVRTDSLSGDQVSELLRLRGEVGRLRQEVVELKRLQADGRRVGPGVSGRGEGYAGDSKVDELNIDLPRSAWSFAGYGSPEAVLQTLMWARGEGDSRSVVACLAPAFVEKAQKAWGDKFEDEVKSQLPGRIQWVSDCTILKREMISDSEVRLWYRVVEQDELKNSATSLNVTAKRVGNEWKLVP